MIAGRKNLSSSGKFLQSKDSPPLVTEVHTKFLLNFMEFADAFYQTFTYRK